MTSDKRWHYSLLGLGGDTDGILVTAEERGWLGPRPHSQGVPSRATQGARGRNANSPDTLDSRRRTVRADTLAPSPTDWSRHTGPPVYGAVMNANTSAATTSRGAFPTTVKNTLKSSATAGTVFGRNRTARNSR